MEKGIRKCLCVVWIVLGGVAVTGCRGETAPDSQGASREETPGWLSEAEGNAASSDEEQTVPTTIGDYLSVAEELWRKEKEGIFWNPIIFQNWKEVDLKKDYGGEWSLAEDFAETGEFTLTLSVDGTPDNLYVLEGKNGEYNSIFFGGAYLLDGVLFVGTSVGVPPYSLDLETRTLTDCQKEYEAVQNLYSDWLQGQPEDTGLRIHSFHPTAYIEDCLMYCATISEASDIESAAAIFAAFDKSRSLRAYLLLGAENIPAE